MTHISRKYFNLIRRYEVRVYGGWGDGPSATVYLGNHSVQIRFGHEGHVSAEIDGEPVDAERAAQLLTGCYSTVTLSSEEPLAAQGALEALHGPEIGKARACTLHKIMGKLGLPNAQHYGLAAAALGEWEPLPSLATISEREARVIWGHLCQLYPGARQVAAEVSARDMRRRARPAALSHAA